VKKEMTGIEVHFVKKGENIGLKAAIFIKNNLAIQRGKNRENSKEYCVCSTIKSI